MHIIRIALVAVLFAHGANSMRAADIQLQLSPDKTQEGYVEIRGVGAGPFAPQMWQAGNLNLLPDIRHPLIEPRPGNCRNIYAPSVVDLGREWRVFFGAWDGVPTGNDCIYSLLTSDFLTFRDRHTVIEHGPFQHVCNVSAIGLPGGAISLMCTAYPDTCGLNKPAYFSSPDGRLWNGSPAPYAAATTDIISVSGYDKYRDADINGMNVILHEDGVYRLYFCNFKDCCRVFRASGTDGKTFTYEGVALADSLMVNDVKKFIVGGEKWYLMGMHFNRDVITYSLSRDGMKFDKMQTLLSHLDEADRYIVAVGFVTRGTQEQAGRQVLGVLYGAGAVPSLDANRIFARWLQKKAVFVADNGTTVAGTRALGPDRQLVPLSSTTNGHFEFYAENGTTPLGRSASMRLEPRMVLEQK